MNKRYLFADHQKTIKELEETYKRFEKGVQIKLFLSEEVDDEFLKYLIDNLDDFQVTTINYKAKKFENKILPLVEKCNLEEFSIETLEYSEFEDVEKALKEKHTLRSFSYKSKVIQDLDPFLKCLTPLKDLQSLCLSNILISSEFYDIFKSNQGIIEIQLEDLNGVETEKMLILLKDQQNLSKLILKDFPFNEECDSLLREILKIKKMKTMKLNRVEFSIMGVIYENYDISLQTLKLDKCKIYNKNLPRMAEFLKKNRSLKELSLLYNPFADEGLSYLCKGLVENKSINYLGLTFPSRTSFKSLECFENVFKTNSFIKVLEIYKMKMGSLIKPFMNGLKSNESIEKLVLKRCEIGDDDCEYIGECLMENKKIERMSLEMNNIKAKGVELLFKHLHENTTLKYLNLSKNEIEDKGCKNIGDYFPHGNLQSFNLSETKITDEGVSFLMNGLSRSQSLKIIDLNKTLITEKSIQDIYEMLLYNHIIYIVRINQELNELTDRYETYIDRNSEEQPMKITARHPNINFYFI